MCAWNIRGRGETLEEIVSFSNSFYKKNGVCRVDKAATPVKVTKVEDGTKVVEGYYEKKSTVDFYGIAQGLYLAFDAKEVAGVSIPLKNIQEHQIEYMKDVNDQGGISFVLVSFTKNGRYFLLPFELLYEAYEGVKRGGKKSIHMDELPQELEIKLINGMRLAYLDAVNEYLVWKEKNKLYFKKHGTF